LGTLLFSQCDRLIIGWRLDTRALGVYAAITNITAQINALSALPVQPLLPLVSGASTAGEAAQEDLRRRVQEALQMNVLMALALGGALALFAPWIIRIILPGADEQSVLLLRMATVIYALYSINATGYFILLGLGRAGVCTKIVLASGILAVLLIGAGAAYLGLLGGVAGNVGYLGTLALTVVGLKRLKIRLPAAMGWLRVPLLWFCLTVPIGFLVPDTLLWKTAVFVVQFGLLGAWWISCQRQSFLLLLKGKI
jgi:O-antigen/teichoic acid export membrane protein